MARTASRAAFAAAVGLALLLLAFSAAGENLYSKTFRSPGLKEGPGDAREKNFLVEMPQGHIAIRSLDAQLVDEDGVPISLSDTYLHHWIILPVFIPSSLTDSIDEEVEDWKKLVFVPNSGVCPNGLVQWFGLGAETRGTNTTVPPPYGIVIGDPEKVPLGYDEKWILNLHAIDTRGAVDVRGCTECRCDLFNVTIDEFGRPLEAGYEGGLRCCYDQTHCAVRGEFKGGPKRMVFLEYRVTWVDMSDEVVPVKVYVLDVTDDKSSDAAADKHRCHVEYTVPKCGEGESKCIHTAEDAAFLPDGGDVIYAVGHQHTGGVGIALHNEDGEEICSSFPIYGTGREAANEAGYVVGMSTCYPKPGSVTVRGGEKLRLTSKYNNEDRHTGVMGLFYLLVADDQSPARKHNFHTNLVMVALAITATFIFIGYTVSRHFTKRRVGPDYQLV